jgi:transcriptional regulator GlxA family with amidase domain
MAAFAAGTVLGWLRSAVIAKVTALTEHRLAQPVARAAVDGLVPAHRGYDGRFLASTGTIPFRWLLRERVRLAQRLLETSDLIAGIRYSFHMQSAYIT